MPIAVPDRSTLVRLCAAGVLAYASYAICRTPLLPLFARDLGAGPASVGFIMGASTLTGVALKLPAGALSDVLGRQRLLIAGAVLFAALPFAYLGISAIAGLVAVRFLHGSATAIFGPVASATLSDMAPAARRGAWLSLYSTAQGVGQAAGPVAAGYVIASGRFDLAFIMAGAVAIAVPLIVAGASGAAPARLNARRWQEFREGVAEVGRDRRVLMTSAVQAAQFVLNGMLIAFLPLYGRDALGLTTAELGWLFGAQTLTTLAVRPILGHLSDRTSRKWIIVAGLAICCGAVFSISLVSTAAGLAVAVIVYAAGGATTTAATSAHITDVTRRGRYGAAHGVFGTIYDIGDAAGPIVAGLLVASVGYARMFQTLALVAFGVTLLFAAASGRRPITASLGEA